MNFFIFLCLISSSFASVFTDLQGNWLRSGSAPDERPVVFIKVNGNYYFHGQDKYVFENGKLSHTIDQSVKVTMISDNFFEGTVDFFDSRGCTYKALKVVGEFVQNDVVNVLMTVPRYKVVTRTVTRNDSRERPRFCPVPYPGRGYYVCGTEREVISRTTSCELLETVEVPVQLLRFR